MKIIHVLHSLYPLGFWKCKEYQRNQDDEDIPGFEPIEL